jgi:uncharacterized protein (TIGR00369 family)
MEGQVSHPPPAGFEPYDGAGPFVDLIGPVHSRGEGEERVFALRIDDRHLNRRGSAQGGLLATLVDFAIGSAIGADAADDAQAATVSLTTDYLGPAEKGDWVEAHTEVDRLGGTLAFADCSLRVGEREVVRGRAVFAVLSDD